MSDNCESCTWSEAVSNAAKASIRIVKNVVNGEQVIVDNDLASSRMEICNGCEFRKGEKCRACGCFLALKTSLTTETCPKGKW